MATFVQKLMVGISLQFFQISVIAGISAENKCEHSMELQRPELQTILLKVEDFQIWAQMYHVLCGV